MDLDIEAVYVALAAAVNAAELRPHGFQVTALPYGPDSMPDLPCWYPAEFVGNYNKTFSGLTDLTITSRLLLSRSDDKAGQRQAQKLAGAGANTIRSALHAARGAPGQEALDGAADDLVLQRVSGPRLVDIGEKSFYVLEFTIFVMG